MTGYLSYLFALCFALTFCACNAQYGDQTAVNVSFTATLRIDNQWKSGTTWLWSLVHLPNDYTTTSNSYPLLVFFHGAGEITLTRELSHLSRVSDSSGPCAEIKKGNNMQFTVDGVLHKFIVVCPQFFYDTTIPGNTNQNGRWPASGFAQNNFITSITNLYRVNLNRIYVTGLSDGGFSALGASTPSYAYASRYAAVAPVAFENQAVFRDTGMCILANASTPIRIWTGTGDSAHYNENNKYVTVYNQCNPRPSDAVMVGVPGGHDGAAFDRIYSPGNDYSNPNVYQWLLGNQRGTAVPTSTPTSAPPTPKPTTAPTTSPTCPAHVLGSGTGLRGEYYAALQSFTNLMAVRIDSTINFSWGTEGPFPAPFPVDGFTVRWTGVIKAKQSGLHTFYGTSDDGIRISVNNVQVVNAWVDRSLSESSGTITLTAGNSYPFVVEYYDKTGNAAANVSWSASCLPKEIIPASQLSYSSFSLCA